MITLDKQLILLDSNQFTNSLSEDYSHPDGHTRQTTDALGFKPFTTNKSVGMRYNNGEQKLNDSRTWWERTSTVSDARFPAFYLR